MAADEEVLYCSTTSSIAPTRSATRPTRGRWRRSGTQGVVDALGIIGYYTLLAMVMNTARTPMPPGATAALAPLPK